MGVLDFFTGSTIGRGIGKTFGTGGSTSYTPPEVNKKATTATQLSEEQQAAFNPMGDPRITGLMDVSANDAIDESTRKARGLASRGGDQRAQAEANLASGFRSPQIQRPTSLVSPQAVNNQTAGYQGGQSTFGSAYDASQQSRGTQAGLLNTATGWAQGNMPSVGQAMVGENAARAQQAIGQTTSQSNQNFGRAALDANTAYQQAYGDQAFATQRAGQQAARQMQDGTEAAIRGQSALAAQARGGNMALALRGAGQNAALQTQQGNVGASRAQQDANFQAAQIAQQGQRQASAQQAAANLQTAGAVERANLEALGAQRISDAQASQLASQEQQNALGLAGSLATNARQGDLGMTQAGLSAMGLGLQADQQANALGLANAGNRLAADQFNQNMGLNYDQLGSANQLATNNLNASVMTGQAQRGQADQQFALGTLTGNAQMDAQVNQAMAAAQMGSQQQLVQLMAQLDDASRQRVLDAYGIKQGLATERRGQNTQMFGAGASAIGAAGGFAAMFSDRRAKKKIKSEKTHDFRKATQHSYEYKEPDKPGRAPGRRHGMMADQLPKQLLHKGEDGLMMVDMGNLMFSLAPAVGDLQKKVDHLQKKVKGA